MPLQGKIAVVTGASRGIGRAIAQRLARDGALVAVHYANRADAARSVVSEIEAENGEAFVVQADIGSVEQVRRMYQTLDAELTNRRGAPQFDILVNNAGAGGFAAFEKVTEELFDRVVAVDLKGPFFTAQLALPRLRDGGRIINISSGGSKRPSLGMPAYAIVKAAVNALTEQLAAALGKRGITVNTIAPGPVYTEASVPFMGSAEQQDALAKVTALGRLGQPSDIANVAAFLASDESGWVTGQYIEASGGFRLV